MTEFIQGGSASSIQGAAITNRSAPTLPIPNSLNPYRLVNYNFTLSVLTVNQYNFPKTSYKGPAQDLGKIILQSGSGSSENRINLSLPTTAGTLTKKFDFYIDDVNITGMFGLNSVTGNTNATSVTFSVTEPHSMGLFFLALQQSAIEQGFQNWVDAPFLLTVKFTGHTDSGSHSVPLPESTRHFPLKFSNINMRVTASGALYDCEAFPYNEFAYTPDVVVMKEDVTIQGTTLVEILQTGEKSLQRAVSAQLLKLKETKGADQPDDIRIIFPKDSDLSPTFVPHWVQPAEELNSIAPMTLSIENYSGTTDFVQDKFKEGTDSSGTKILTRDAVTLVPSKGSFTFSKGGTITDAINQVMILSQYGKECADPKRGNRGDKITWWKIESQLFFDKPEPTGHVPRIYVYRIIPYKVDASVFSPPGTVLPAPASSIPAKQYDYIFTGKNTEIKNLDISFNAAFRHAAFAEYNGVGSSNKIVKPAGSTSSVPSTNQPTGVDFDFLSLPGVPSRTNVPRITPPLLANVSVPLFQPTTLPILTSSSTYRLGGISTEYNQTGSSNGDLSTQYVRQLYDAILAGVDMLTITMKIFGDVYYLGDTCMGNYVAPLTDNDNINGDMQANYQTSDVSIQLNCQTPIDIDPATGLYLQTAGLPGFSGLYLVTTVASTFKNGIFEQDLTLHRRPGQVATTSTPYVERAITPNTELSNYA